jgi:hypothetical protein
MTTFDPRCEAWPDFTPDEIVRRVRCLADDEPDAGDSPAQIWRHACDTILLRMGKHPSQSASAADAPASPSHPQDKIQVAREAAAWAFEQLGFISFAASIRAGKSDDAAPVQAALRALSLPSPQYQESRTDANSGGETFETIAQWCEETFGPATPERIASRAAEEMDELLADPHKVEEAADIVIILSRHSGLWAAVEAKMAVNRKRKWRLMGDGSGYHVKDASPLSSQKEQGE